MNPEIERFTVHSVFYYYGESFVKNKIKPDDIIGVIVPTKLSPFPQADEFERENRDDLFLEIKNLCMIYGIPLYEVKTKTTQNSVTTKGKIELVWPKGEINK